MPACSESDADAGPDSGNIRLDAVVGAIETGSRADADPGAGTNPYYAYPYRGTTPSEDNSLDAALWFRLGEAGSVYENNPSAMTNLPVHTAVNFKGPQKEFVLYGGKNLTYPTDATASVCCVGLYPNDEGQDGGWTLGPDNMSASHPIDGVTDLMFAKEISGTWNAPLASLRFEHLLTWVKIAICATSHDTAEAWGAIEQIRIVNSKSNVSVDLKSGTPTYSNADPAGHPINTLDSPVELLTTMHEVGSVLCSPEMEYTLEIKTANNTDLKKITLKLDLMDLKDDSLKPIENADQARGKCFVLSLYFKPYKVVEAVCILNSWNNQSEDIYVKTN